MKDGYRGEGMSEIDKTELDHEITRETDIDSSEENTCDDCGTPLSIGRGCLSCMPCSGEYQPGTEECDRCHLADECVVPRHFPS